MMDDNEVFGSFKILRDLIDNKEITPKKLIKKTEDGIKEGKIPIETLTYLIQHLALIDKLNRLPNKNKYINSEELIALGFFDSIDEVHEIISNNPDDIFKDMVLTMLPPDYPEPTEMEINQYVDSEDINKVCVICYRRRRHTVFLDCGHIVCCTVCSKELVQKSIDDDKPLQCILCKNTVKNIQRVFT
jgi:hypothetical protein